MKTPRFKKLSWWLACVYLAWSVFVYFGTLGREPHSWWPIFLYHMIWPWSWIEKTAFQPLLEHWLVPDPKTAPSSVWMLMDYISGGFYILVGTVWYWIVGKLISRLLPMQEEEPNQPLQGTPGKAPSSSTEPEARRP